jgi:hypothetical protein
MKNAHLRFGSLLFKKYSEKLNASTNITTWCDRYVCDDNQLHLVSFFGGDTEMAAFSAAIQEGLQMGVEFAGHSTFYRGLGPNAKCYKIQFQVPSRKRKLVHIVAISESLLLNGTQNYVYCLNDTPQAIWDTLVYILGLPAAPEWAEWIYDRLDDDGKIEPLQSVGMKAVRVDVTRLELMTMLRKGLLKKKLTFPPTNGPLHFQERTIADLLAIDELDTITDTTVAA